VPGREGREAVLRRQKRQCGNADLIMQICKMPEARSLEGTRPRLPLGLNRLAPEMPAADFTRGLAHCTLGRQCGNTFIDAFINLNALILCEKLCNLS
jgi:hypothetical protein